MKIHSLLILLILFIFSCTSLSKKIFYLNSYHAGYGSSDAITTGIHEALEDENVRLEIFHMDTKRNTDSTFIAEQARQALHAIDEFQPDVIIASDDNAVKYVVAPHFKSGPIPVVFCGVNWSCDQYGLPTDNVTGMLEVLPLEQAFSTLKSLYPDASTLAVISENTTSSRKNKELLDSLYRLEGFTPSYFLCDDFKEWKLAFNTANAEADLIFFPTNGAITGWDDETAKAILQENLSIPMFTPDDFMMTFAVFGFTKVAEEQGEWAANRALDIIDGQSPADIPVVENKQARVFLNKNLAEKINFENIEALGPDITIIE